MNENAVQRAPDSVGRQALAYLFWIGLAEAVGGIVGALVTAPAIPSWYATLAKPSWTPPSWLFSLVWTLLFALMGGAAARVWIHRRDTRSGRASLAFYGAHLVLNGAWSVLFFGLRSPAAGFAGTVALSSCVVVLVVWWWRLDRPAALLMTPYLAWVSYATALNAAIWRLN